MLRDVLGVSQDANLFEDAPCTDLSLDLWDPKLDGETRREAAERHRMAVVICREDCHALDACVARRDRLHAAGRKTAGVWAGVSPDGGRPPLSGCGSPAGFQRHRRAGEDPCAECAHAQRVWMRQYMAGRRRGE